MGERRRYGTTLGSWAGDTWRARSGSKSRLVTDSAFDSGAETEGESGIELDADEGDLLTKPPDVRSDSNQSTAEASSTLKAVGDSIAATVCE